MGAIIAIILDRPVSATHNDIGCVCSDYWFWIATAQQKGEIPW